MPLIALDDVGKDWGGPTEPFPPPGERQEAARPVVLPPCATPYEFPNAADIPPRSWLYGGHYIRGVATATIAPGGHGKTTISLFEAITMGFNGLRVWYLSGEDPKVEIDRRIAAHFQHHQLDPLKITGALFVDDRETAEAEQARVPKKDRARHLRVDNGKRNMAPPEDAKWMRLVSVHLPNGDNVQAIEFWEFPKGFGEVSFLPPWMLSRSGTRKAKTKLRQLFFGLAQTGADWSMCASAPVPISLKGYIRETRDWRRGAHRPTTRMPIGSSSATTPSAAIAHASQARPR